MTAPQPPAPVVKALGRNRPFLKRCACREEAAQLPDVVTSNVDPATFQARQTEYVPPELAQPACTAYVPDTGWLAEFLADFAALRRRLQGCGFSQRGAIASSD